LVIIFFPRKNIQKKPSVLVFHKVSEFSSTKWRANLLTSSRLILSLKNMLNLL
jgi:hypothetical protein